MGQNNVFHNVFRDVCRGIACRGTSCQKIATQVRFDDFKSELPHAKLNVRPPCPPSTMLKIAQRHLRKKTSEETSINFVSGGRGRKLGL